MKDRRGKEKGYDATNEGEPLISCPIAGESENRLLGAAFGGETGGLTRLRDCDDHVAAKPIGELTRGLHHRVFFGERFHRVR